MGEEEVRKCHFCGVEMQFLGKETFVTGGLSLFFFPETLLLYIYVCPKCRRTELFMDEKTIRKQLQLQCAVRKRDE